MTKTCLKCGETKNIAEFYRRSASKDGLQYNCKKCHKGVCREWGKTPNGKAVRRAAYERLRQDPDRYARALAASVARGKTDKALARARAYSRDYSKSEMGKKTRRTYLESDEGKRIRRDRERRRRAEDPALRLKQAVSANVRNAVKAAGGSKAGQSTFDHLPHSPQDLRDHLESLWEPWMNWDNYGCGAGKWTIDHVVPQSHFRYTTLEDPAFQECWALTNLQPLEFIANIRKGDRVA